METQDDTGGETRTYEMDWYTNNPTYVTQSVYPVWISEPSYGALQIEWDKDTESARIGNPPEPTLSQSEARRLASQLNHAAQALPALVSIVKRERNHPEKFGLVFQRIPEIHAQQSMPYGQWAKDGVSYRGLAALPEWEATEGPFGWFAPDADPEKFGTLFLYAAYENEYQGSSEFLHVRWCVGQVGRKNAKIDSVDWNDKESIEELVEIVLNDESDAYMAMDVLSDFFGRIPVERRQQNRRQAILRGRHAFARKRDQI